MKTISNTSYVFAITIVLSFFAFFYSSYKAKDQLVQLFKHGKYFAHKDKFIKKTIHINRWYKPPMFFSVPCGSSDQLEKSTIYIDILNSKQPSLYQDGNGFFTYEYIDEFHTLPKGGMVETDTGFVDLSEFNRNFEIYFNQEDWIAFYDPYIQNSFFAQVWLSIKTNYWLAVCLTSPLIFLLFLKLGNAFALKDPFVFDTVQQQKYKSGSFILATVPMILLSVFAIGYSFSFIYNSFDDLYVHHDKYKKLSLTINSFNVYPEYDVEREGNGKFRSTVVWKWFAGYTGCCYSKDLNNGKTSIDIKRNRHISNVVTDSLYDYKYEVWFNPENGKAYLPSMGEKQQSQFMFILNQMFDYWYLYISIPYWMYIYFRIKHQNKKETK